MLALASGPQGQNPTLILIIIIAAVVVAVCWRTILKIGIAAVIIGFAFLLATSLLDIVHGLHVHSLELANLVRAVATAVDIGAAA